LTRPISISRATERLHGPPSPPRTNCSAPSRKPPRFPVPAARPTRLVRQSASEQAKPAASSGSRPGMEARFLAPSPSARFPASVSHRACSPCPRHRKPSNSSLLTPRKNWKRSSPVGHAALSQSARGDAYEFLIDAEPKSISHITTSGRHGQRAGVGILLSHLSRKLQTAARSRPLFPHATLTIATRVLKPIPAPKRSRIPAAWTTTSLPSPRSLPRSIAPKRKVRLLGVALSGLSSRRPAARPPTKPIAAKNSKNSPKPPTASATSSVLVPSNSAALCAATILIPAPGCAPLPNVYTGIHERSRPHDPASQLPASHSHRARPNFWRVSAKAAPVEDLWSPSFAADARSTYGFTAKDVEWERNPQAPRWKRLGPLSASFSGRSEQALPPPAAFFSRRVRPASFSVRKPTTSSSPPCFSFFCLLSTLADQSHHERDLEIAREIQSGSCLRSRRHSGAEVAF